MLKIATLFLGLYSLGLMVSPAARARSWEVDLRWQHWLAFLLWVVLFATAHYFSVRYLPARDPYLLPAAALLSGWGLLTVWRLYPSFGARQTVWLAISLSVFTAGLRFPSTLKFLRQFKYIWLTSGLLLTGATLLLGTNPSGGNSPRLWLGCCGIYLQPSEPLKLLLIVYLSAYLADRLPLLIHSRLPKTTIPRTLSPLLPLLAPTLIMTGLALLLLLAQRDLGTTSIFLFLYTTIVYIASGRKWFLLVSSLSLALAGAAGYLLFDVVRLRIDAWINPWLDPSGRSFQIVQSLIAVANGGLPGRGPGLGNPGLVPVPHSDFIFAAIAEETGLVGVIGLLAIIALLATRGLRVALHASDSYRRYLAAGLTTHLAAQSILIIGGNLRLLPLTGVTLPFVSYGGSSLLVSFLSLLILLHISNQEETKPAALPDPRPYLQLNALLLAGLAAAGLVSGWWMVYRSANLLARTDNPRRAIADRFVRRGSILDRNHEVLNASIGQPGEYQRLTQNPPLSPILGYTNPVYGQSGVEASLDLYLRGLQGNPSMMLWWNYLLYGQPPPGLDVRLSLDLGLQRVADAHLGDHPGALVLLNADSGEILAIASHPAFNSNTLDKDWDNLVRDPQTPLFNRATQGLYPPGAVLGPLLLASSSANDRLPELPLDFTFSTAGEILPCARPLPTWQVTWGEAISQGCPGAVATLGNALGEEALIELFQSLGFYTSPQIRIPTDSTARPQAFTNPGLAALGLRDPSASYSIEGVSGPAEKLTGTSGQALWISPLQMAIAAATLSSGGVRPAVSLVVAVNTPEAGWTPLPALQESQRVLPVAAAVQTANKLSVKDKPFWQVVATAPMGNRRVTWYLAGTLSESNPSIPLALAVLIEEDNPGFAAQVGQALMQAAIGQ